MRGRKKKGRGATEVTQRYNWSGVQLIEISERYVEENILFETSKMAFHLTAKFKNYLISSNSVKRESSSAIQISR